LSYWENFKRIIQSEINLQQFKNIVKNCLYLLFDCCIFMGILQEQTSLYASLLNKLSDDAVEVRTANTGTYM